MEVEGGEGTRFLRVRSKGTETPSKDGQSWRWKESRSCWESKRPDGLAKVGSGSEPDEKGGARGWWECGMKPARGDGDVADGEGGQLGLRWSHRRSPGRQLLSSSSGTVFVSWKHLAAASFLSPHCVHSTGIFSLHSRLQLHGIGLKHRDFGIPVDGRFV